MQRPTSVTVFGALNIAFALFGFVGIAFSAVILLIGAKLGAGPNPIYEAMASNTIYRTYMLVMIPLGAVACCALLASGIGLFFMKPWARAIAIGYAIYAILGGIVGTLVNLIVVFLPALENARGQSGPAYSTALVGGIAGVGGAVIGLVFPGLLLYFMFRRNVVEAFRDAREALPVEGC